MLVIPLSFPIAYGHLLGKGRGISILAAMLIGFGVMLALGLSEQSGPTGLETRFGSFGSTLFLESSVATNTGAANASLTGMSPNAVIGFFLGMFVQAIPGADGTGMMMMIIFVVLTLFLVGLMVGKTPEFMSMKINPRDVNLAAFVFLIHPALILIPSVMAYTTENAQVFLEHRQLLQHLLKFCMNTVQLQQTMDQIILERLQILHFGIYPQHGSCYLVVMHQSD